MVFEETLLNESLSWWECSAVTSSCTERAALAWMSGQLFCLQYF